MPDSYTYMCVRVRIPVRLHRIHPVGNKVNTRPRRLNNLFGGLMKWSNGLSHLTSCEAIVDVLRIESAKCSLHLL